MGTANFFGSDELDFGACNVYHDTATGGANINLGGFDSVKISKQVKKVELKEAQAGDQPADKAVSGQIYTIALGMSRANAERLEATVDGINLVKDSGGNVTMIEGVQVLGQRDSSKAVQIKVVKIIEGEESTDPLETIYFLKVAPSSENVEVVYDATTQRYYAVMYLCYKSDEVNEDGKPRYWRSGVAA